MACSFFDTNVLVYIASGDAAKADRAEEIIAGGGSINIQVLNELTNVARRKMGLSWAETNRFLASFRSLLPVHPITVEVHETGIELAQRFNFAIYGAMIAAAALHAGCDKLYSEDMQDGMVIENRLQIVNPFRT